MNLYQLFEKIKKQHNKIPRQNHEFIDSLRNQYTRQHWLSEKQIKALLEICRRHGVL